MKLANMVDLGSAGSNTLQVQVLPIVIFNLSVKAMPYKLGKGSYDGLYGWRSTPRALGKFRGSSLMVESLLVT